MLKFLLLILTTLSVGASGANSNPVIPLVEHDYTASINSAMATFRQDLAPLEKEFEIARRDIRLEGHELGQNTTKILRIIRMGELETEKKRYEQLVERCGDIKKDIPKRMVALEEIIGLL